MLWTETTRKGYANLYSRMTINPGHDAAIDRICTKILANRARYLKITEATGVPWWWVAIVHNLESGCDFSTYLGNGEPLNRVTRLVPKGRGPFSSFEAGAIDALRLHDLHKITDWSLEHALFQFERWNGWGYTSKGINSPYIWSFSNQYTSGKYVADGVWSSAEVSKQCGAAVILKRLIEKGEVMIEFEALMPLIKNVAPTVASKLIGPQAGVAISILAQVLDIVDGDHKAVADKLEQSPTSVATSALQKAEEALKAPVAPVVQASPQQPSAPVPASPNGVLVDQNATTVKSLVSGLLFLLAAYFIKDVTVAHSIADALAPLAIALASGLGGAALQWIMNRSIGNANTNTLKMIGG